MRRAAKVDRNHPEIVAALRTAGVQVLSLAAIGKGVPDLLLLHRGRLQLVEVKDGSQSPSRRRLTPLQEAFRAAWPVAVIDSADDAIALFMGSSEPQP